MKHLVEALDRLEAARVKLAVRLIPDGQYLVPESASSALWGDSPLWGASCMPNPAMASFPGGEGIRTTCYPARGIIRAHRGESPIEAWEVERVARRWGPQGERLMALFVDQLLRHDRSGKIQPSNSRLRRFLRRH